MNNTIALELTNVIKTQNGTRIVFDHCPHVDSIAFSIMIKTGSLNESENVMGISHFLEHVIYRKNGNQIISTEMDEIGGFVNAFTNKEFTCYYGKVLKSNFKKGFELLFEHVFSPGFNELDINIERKVILEEFRQYKDMMQEQIRMQSISNIFPLHPLSYDILGNEDSLNNIKAENLYKYHKSHYTPNNSVISISGNLEEIHELDLISFIDLNLHSYNSRNKINDDVPIFQFGTHKIQKNNIGQSYLSISYPSYSRKTESKKAASLILINALLTGIKSSSLQKTLREEKGLIYSIYSYPVLYENTGLFQIITSTSKNRENEVLEIIFSKLKEIIINGFDEQIIQRAKNRLKGEYAFQLEKLEDRMIFFGRKELLKENYFNDFLNTVDSLTIDEINKFGKEILKHQPSITIISNE